MFFMSLCMLCIFGLGIISHIICGIPKVRKALEKLLNT